MANDRAQRETTVSVVIPCYYSEKTIGKVYELSREELLKLGYHYEFVLVNDGSTDGTFDVISEICAHDSNVRGVNFARNFGQHAAIIAGLRQVTGDLVLLMDDDMQTHPSQFGKLLHEIENGDWDVVFGEYPMHKEAGWRRLGSDFTLWTMRVLTKRPKDITASNFFVMKRFVSDELIKYDGPYVYIQGLLFRATNKMTNVEVEHFDREVGSSGYTFKALVRLWSNVLNFSMVPLRAGTVIGAAIAAISFIVAIVLIVQRLINPSIQLGWSSIMVTITFFAGSILLFLGLMGEYLGRLFMMANKAPQYVTRASINCEKDDDEK